MSIRQTLLLAISLLSLIILYVNGSAFLEAREEKKAYSSAYEASETIDLLLTSAGNWAVERGVTNSGLNGASAAPKKMRAVIQKRRENADNAYKEAFEQLQHYDFEGKDELVARVKGHYSKAVALRTLADKNLQLPKYARSEALLKKWVPAMSALVISSQDLRFAITEQVGMIDQELGRQSQLKHFSWMMSEYAGRERAIIGGTISANTAIATAKLQKLGIFRGNVEAGWDLVQKLGAHSNEEVRESISRTQALFFGNYEKIRKSVYQAGVAGEVYPVNAPSWVEQATNAINTILEIQAASTEETKAYVSGLINSADQKLLFNGVVLFIGTLVSVYGFYTVICRVSKPLAEISDSMSELASGDITVTVPSLERKDEVGAMAQSVQVFKENAIAKNDADVQIAKEKAAADARVAGERKAAMQKLADQFEERVQGIINSVASSASQLSQSAQTMVALIGDSHATTQNTVQSANEASGNVQSVAAAAEEMSSTINEIAGQIQRSNQLIQESVNSVEGADRNANELSRSSDKVEEVVELISDIAGQINLLALNATIESARAGEAGKGFAVVAQEVKNLASETDKSIQEISKVILEMNSASGNIIESLKEIKGKVENISDASTSIAAAVEEQSVTTNDVAGNISSAAQGTQSITDNLKQVGDTSIQTQASSEEVLMSAKELSSQADMLSEEVKKFLEELKS